MVAGLIKHVAGIEARIDAKLGDNWAQGDA
jgi:hypothetical protein